MSNRSSQKATTKRDAIRQERMKKERQKRTQMILIFALGAALIVGAIIAVRAMTTPSVANLVEVTPNARPMADKNSMGDPNAPVKIVEYSDFQCQRGKLERSKPAGLQRLSSGMRRIVDFGETGDSARFRPQNAVDRHNST